MTGRKVAKAKKEVIEFTKAKKAKPRLFIGAGAKARWIPKFASERLDAVANQVPTSRSKTERRRHGVS